MGWLSMNMRQVAAFLQKAPWIVNLARILWRIRQPKFSAGAVGVVFNAQGQVLLVEHVFHPYAPWGLPGGWVDRHESPADTVRRELSEELSQNVEVGELLIAEMGYGNHLDFAYLCQARGPIGRLSQELLAYDWWDLHDLPKLFPFHQHAIQQALTMMNPSVEL
jgi:ADP-ribose pyrophosphatase YjhB (NUDIX family)